MNEELERMAAELERAAAELEKAAAHCRVSAEHFRGKEVPRACAHAFATLGHLSAAETIVRERAEFHATKAVIE